METLENSPELIAGLGVLVAAGAPSLEVIDEVAAMPAGRAEPVEVVDGGEADPTLSSAAPVESEAGDAEEEADDEDDEDEE